MPAILGLILGLLFLLGTYPLASAWWANRHYSLWQAMHWLITAWTAWLLTAFFADPAGRAGEIDPARYLALVLTGCAAVAILGARRPHVGAWNCVVLGLLAVMVLPLFERVIAGSPSLDVLRLTFLAGTLAVGVLNYLPTALAPAAMLAAMGCTLEMIVLAAPDILPYRVEVSFLARVCVTAAPWAGWVNWRRQPPPLVELDRLWLDFRNRYGLVWGQRVREQFNAAAVHAGWPVFLAWRGLRRTVLVIDPEPGAARDMLETFKALLKRFAPDI